MGPTGLPRAFLWPAPGAVEDAPFLFLHLTFQEFLTARYLAHRINDDGWDEATVPLDGKHYVPAKLLLDRKAWLPSWQEVVVLAAGQLKDALPLLETLADPETDDIFRHRLRSGRLVPAGNPGDAGPG